MDALDRPALAPVDTSHEDVFDFLARGDSDDFDWIIPGVLERGDRMILTGREGSGKSMLVEQIAVQCAAGIHPFTLEDIPAVRVLVVDLEYSHRELRRRFRDLSDRSDGKLKPGQLFLDPVPGGIDLSTATERARFFDRVTSLAPDILVIGPMYKLSWGDPESERDAKLVAAYLDTIRDVGISLIIEAHLAHKASDGRPFGSSLWRHWPELGLWLQPGESVQKLKAWRPARHEAPAVPSSLRRGGEWPFTIVRRPRDELWATIMTTTATAKKKPTIRELADQIGPSTNKDAVNRALNEHRTEWEERWRGRDEE